LPDDGGLAKLEAKMKAVVAQAKQAVQPALLKQADIMAGDMRRFAETSRDTGALIDSIAVTAGGEQTPPYSQPGGSMTVPDTAVAITVGNTEVRYAHLVEYGTSKMKAEPYFWPAYRLDKKKSRTAIKRAIGNAVKANWGSE